MFTFISPNGDVVKSKNLRHFSAQHSLPYSHVRDLACGRFQCYRGWLSPKATRKRRKRFTTVLVNSKDGTRHTLGQTVSGFARAHNLCANELYKLINGRKWMYRHFCLEKTLQLVEGAHPPITVENFPKGDTKPHPVFRDATVGIVERSEGHLSEHQ